MHIEVLDKTNEGILENYIFIVERKENVWIEIASIMNPRIKWIYRDYVNILKETSFSKIEFAEIRKMKSLL